MILVVVDRLSKYAHFLSLKHPFTGTMVAEKFVKEIIRLHGYPTSIISDRDQISLASFGGSVSDWRVQLEVQYSLPSSE